MKVGWGVGWGVGGRAYFKAPADDLEVAAISR